MGQSNLQTAADCPLWTANDPQIKLQKGTIFLGSYGRKTLAAVGLSTIETSPLKNVGRINNPFSLERILFVNCTGLG